MLDRVPYPHHITSKPPKKNVFKAVMSPNLSVRLSYVFRYVILPNPNADLRKANPLTSRGIPSAMSTLRPITRQNVSTPELQGRPHDRITHAKLNFLQISFSRASGALFDVRLLAHLWKPRG